MRTVIHRWMFSLKNFVRERPNLKKKAKLLSQPISATIGYMYGAYLTLRYVDSYNKFPAIQVCPPLIRLRITKGFGSTLAIHNQLRVESLSARRTPSSLQLGDGAKITIANEFFIGDDVQLVAHNNAVLYVGGRDRESASGVSAKSIVHANKSIYIGTDSIIAQDTYITDSDWHPINGVEVQRDVYIGNHVWIATGAKILKGSTIGDDCIVAAGAVVTGESFADRTLITGMPARAARLNIGNWSRE